MFQAPTCRYVCFITGQSELMQWRAYLYPLVPLLQETLHQPIGQKLSKEKTLPKLCHYAVSKPALTPVVPMVSRFGLYKSLSRPGLKSAFVRGRELQPGQHHPLIRSSHIHTA